jgi:hypothetical protein
MGEHCAEDRKAIFKTQIMTQAASCEVDLPARDNEESPRRADRPRMHRPRYAASARTSLPRCRPVWDLDRPLDLKDAALSASSP